MKLRIRGNSLRLRLLQNEIAALIENGQVSEKIEFGNAGLTYAVRLTDGSEKISAEFADNEITVLLPKSAAEKWARSDDAVSLEGEQAAGEGQQAMLGKSGRQVLECEAKHGLVAEVQAV